MFRRFLSVIAVCLCLTGPFVAPSSLGAMPPNEGGPEDPGNPSNPSSPAPVGETPQMSRIIAVGAGSVDAVSGNLHLGIPLGPRLPGRIPLGFFWTHDVSKTPDESARNGGELRPVVWPSLYLNDGFLQLTVGLQGDSVVFYRGIDPGRLPSSAALLQAMADRKVQVVPPVEAPAGYQLVQAGPFVIREVLPTSDESRILVVFGYQSTLRAANGATTTAFLGSGACILSGADAIWFQEGGGTVPQNHVMSHFTNRWGDHVQVDEAYSSLAAGFSALQSIQIRDMVQTGVSLTLQLTPTSSVWTSSKVHYSYPAGQVVKTTYPWLTGFDGSIRITNTLGLPEVRLAGAFYSQQRFLPWRDPWGPNFNAFATPPPPVPEGKWDSGFNPTDITTAASDGTSRALRMVWQEIYQNWPQAPVEIHHPSGLVETFAYGQVSNLSSLSFSRWDGRWTGFRSSVMDRSTLPASFEPLTECRLGVTQVRRWDSGGSAGQGIRILRIRPTWRITSPAGTTPIVWACTETRNLTAILDYPTADPAGPFRALRITHPTFNAAYEGQVDSRQGFLFAISAALSSEWLTGTGVPSSPLDLGNQVYQVAVHDGFDLSSWANPLGALTGGLPTNAVARRTRTYAKDLPTRTTVMGNPNVSGASDTYGPVLTEESTSATQTLPSADGTAVPIWSGSLPSEEPSQSIRRRGRIQRSFDVPLMRLLLSTDQKTLDGAGLPTLRFSAPNGQGGAQAPSAGIASADFGTTTYAYDALGRISSQKGDRGGFTAEEQRSYVDGLPLLRETTQNALTGPGGPYYPNPDNSGMVAGKVYTWADTHVQGGPSTVRDKIDGRTESFQYDDLGRETGHTDVLGITTTTSYDAWGRKSQVTRLARGGVGAVTTDYAYDVNGTWKDETLTADGRSLRTRTNLDAFGRAVKVTAYDANGIQATSQSFGYDGFGQKVRQSPVLTRTQASWGNETWAYDGQGRMTDHWDAQGRLLQHVTLQPTWTTIGGITAVWTTIQDDRGFTRSEAVDLLGQKRAVIDQAGQLSESFYDQDGHLIQTLQGNQQRSYTYNAMGWLTSRTEPEEGTTVYSKFTQAGAPLVVQQYGRSGGSVRNAFSTVLNDQLLPAIQSASGPEGSVVRTLTYDPATRLLTALQETQPNGTLTEAYGYDDLFRVSSKTVSDGAQSFNVNRAFDAAGRVTSLTYPAAAGRRDVVGYTYDVLGRMSAVTVNGETRPRGSMVYDQVSDTSVSQVLTYGNNAWTTSRADRGELAQVTHVAPAGTLEDHTMAWTPGGLLTRRGTDTFGYDALQRLSSAHVLNPQTGTYVDQGFSYDRYGNRTSSTTTAPAGTLPATSEALTWTAAYGSSNDLPATVAAVGGSLATGALYDDLGRMKQAWTTPGQAATQTAWTYDPSGRIVKENGTSYLLDAEGLRFRRSKVDGSVNYTVYGFNREPLITFSNAFPGDSGSAQIINQSGAAGGPTFTTHGGSKALRIWHKQGTNCSLGRSLGTFSAGDVVTATVWFMAPPGVHGQVFLGDDDGNDRYDNFEQTAVMGNGQWQCITLTHTMTHPDVMAIYLYGDRDGTTSDSVSVIYDDVSVSSALQGLVMNDSFESGLGSWPNGAGQLCELVTASTATTYNGSKALRIWHKQGTNCSLGRPLGTFAAGDVVTAAVWFMAPPGVHGQVFLGDDDGNDRYDNFEQTAVMGNGQWQRITLTHTMTHADLMAIYLYGDRDGTTSDSVSVIYDDVSVSSALQGLVMNDSFESGLGSWPNGAGQLCELVTASTATTYNGSKALRIWHKQGTNCSLGRPLGTFAAGDVVTAAVWFMAPPGVHGQVFLGDDDGNDRYDNFEQTAVMGNGQWQRITLTHTMTHADLMAIYLYGDRDGTTSDSVSVIYDDVSVSSALQGLVMNDSFESGLGSWPNTAGQLNEIVQATNLLWQRSMIYGFGQLLSESRPDGVIYIQGDQVGSPNVITNASGVLVNRTKNLPFGERLVDGLPNAPKSLRRFTNHEEDPDSNAIYMQARTYLAGYGKFAQVDPAYDQTKEDPETWNLYNYVTNNPVTKTDPDGRMTSQGAMLASTGSYMDNDGHVHFAEDMLSGAAQQATIATEPPQQRTTTTAGGNQGTSAGTTGGTATPVEAQGPVARTRTDALVSSIPVEVKRAIQKSLDASNSPTADDKTGRFHEEGGQWGKGVDGNVLIYPAVPGKVSKPGDKEANVDSGQAVDQEGKNNNLATTDGKWHIHPAGDGLNGKRGFFQGPSSGDLNRPADEFLPTNIVVGAASRRVYFYDAKGVIADVSLSDFMKGVN
ncbi:carbohydrate binding domain-containing protein [Geothrix sp. 21YS21S-4]|uniref:carbohydrate binding domain-containing protein n=1 Tax=Geothrix sp. 21YS21S-4 TaxID=3068889 RepID=UPI0027B9B50E|nr:carbohydrate binding domain-containing protein [Geothrix sp. 21YS21S-4]